MSSAHIPEFLKRLVRRRSGNRCEYCLLPQAGQEAAFHIDHVFPLAEGGETNADNLALACVSCSLRKGARRLAVDPKTDQKVAIFDPRKDLWEEHFKWEGLKIKGLTETGRATVEMLNMNRTLIIAIRREELLAGRSLGRSSGPVE